MTLLKEKVQTILEKQIGAVRKAGLAATAQVRTQVTNRAITILEAKAVEAETVHPNTVRAAVKKGIELTVMYANETANKDVVYMVKKGATDNLGLVFGLEMAGNIDKLAYETLIAQAVSTDQTTEYPKSVSSLKGMAEIEDHVIAKLQEMASKKEYKLTIGAYIAEFTKAELDAIKADIIAKCTEQNNGAVTVMYQYLTEKLEAEVARINAEKEAEQAATIEEQPVTTNTVEEATTEQPAVEEVVIETTTVEEPVAEEPTRYQKNIKCISEYVRGLNLGADITEAIMAQIIADNKERLEKYPFTNKLTDAVTPVVEAAVNKLFPAPTEEVVADNTEAPAIGETPAAEQTTESEEEVVTKPQVQVDIYEAEFNGVDVELVTLEAYKKDVKRLTEFATNIETAYQEHVAGIIENHQVLTAKYDEKFAEMAAKIAELEKANQELDANLKKQTTLRKADGTKIEKLEKEVGRVKVKLKAHNVREITVGNVTEMPEGANVGAVIKSRIKTAGALESSAQSIHKNAPVKIEAAAEATKDGIQWVADRAKDTVDITAKVTNWSTEKLGNGLTLAADKIAPTTEAVAKSALKHTPAKDEKPFVVIRGYKYYKKADGTLTLGE